MKVNAIKAVPLLRATVDDTCSMVHNKCRTLKYWKKSSTPKYAGLRRSEAGSGDISTLKNKSSLLSDSAALKDVPLNVCQFFPFKSMVI